MIEKNIPIPGRKGGSNKYGFAEFEVGDSRLYVGQDEGRIRAAAACFGVRNQKRFTVRKQEGGFRVWRAS